jgi:hypothetical protein
MVKMNKIQKKAQLEISFNWIFILIAGAAILIFFVFVITKESDSAEDKVNAQVSKRMEALLSAVEQNPSAIKDLGFFSTELSFSCVDNSLHQYYIKDSISRQNLDTQMIFSPKELGSAKIIAWTVDFEAPYIVSSLLMLSDDRTVYIFDNTISSSFISSFPKEFTKQVLPPNEINNVVDSGFRRYVIVVSQSNLVNVNLAQGLKLKSSIVSMPNEYELLSGTVKFYDYEYQVSTAPRERGSASFVTKQMLYGAVITGDAELYNCSVSKLLERTRFVDDINVERLSNIRDELPATSICRTIYNTLILDTADTTGNILLKKDASLNFHDVTQRTIFKDNYQAIVTANSRLLSNSCPLIY